MKIGLTYDLREDYGLDRKDQVFADFCHPDEISYMARAIEANGHEVRQIGNMYHLNKLIASGGMDCDYVLVCDEGIASRNREAIVPALLELNHIKYIGSDAYAMAVSQNKHHTKLIAESLGISCPKAAYIEYSKVFEGASAEKQLKEAMRNSGLGFPVVVKPNAEGYSMGVFLAKDMETLLRAVRYNFDNYKEAVLVEEYINGSELYVPVIGTGEEAYALDVGICKYGDGSNIDIFTLEDKCFGVILDEIADVGPDIKRLLFDWTLRLYRHLECVDFGRCDFKLTKDGKPYLLEINPRPGLTQNGPFENCARSIGKSYAEVIGEIIQSAVKRYGE